MGTLRRLQRAGGAAGELIRSGPAGWRDLVLAQWALVRWSLAVRFRPRGRLVKPDGHDPGEDAVRSDERPKETDGSARWGGDPPINGRPTSTEQRGTAERLALALDRAARFGLVRPRCLVRSLALHHLLVGAGVKGSRVRFGVRMMGGRFEAHAWVELHGEVIGDDPRLVERFEPLTELGAWTESLR